MSINHVCIFRIDNFTENNVLCVNVIYNQCKISDSNCCKRADFLPRFPIHFIEKHGLLSINKYSKLIYHNGCTTLCGSVQIHNTITKKGKNNTIPFAVGIQRDVNLTGLCSSSLIIYLAEKEAQHFKFYFLVDSNCWI